DKRSIRDQGSELKIALGVVSEDALWNPAALPNGTLDTEDRNRNGILDLFPFDEDTGLDTIPNGAAGDTDDNYYYNPEARPPDFSGINGTEGTRLASINPLPDTEDLDGDGVIDLVEDYFEFTVSLSQDSRYQIRDNGNGWRLFRIPLSDTAGVHVAGDPSWDNIKHARLWLEGFSQTDTLQIAGIELVGNRWIITAIADSASYNQGERFFVGVINNKENPNYVPPPIQIGEENNIPKREQSLVLSVQNLLVGDTVLAYRPFAGGNNYTQYESMSFWIRGDSDSLKYFVRFGTDSLNFYEYGTPVTTTWQSRGFKLEDLSITKVDMPTTVADTTLYLPDGGWFRLRGRPSFTRIQRMSMGLINDPERTGYAMVGADSVWVDELRLTSVKKEIGMARRVFVEARFADLLSLTTQVESRGEDFLSIGRTRGSGFRTSSYSVSGVMALQKFLPQGMFNLPVNFSLNERKEIPKFRTGDDIILSKELEEAQTSKSGTRSMSVSLRKTPSPNKWLRYTLEAIGLSFGISDSYGTSVTRVDSSRTLSGTVSYQFTPPGKPAINIPFGRGRKFSLFLLPSSFSFTGRGVSTHSRSYERARDDPFMLIPRSNIRRKVGDFGFQTAYSPFSNLRCSYSINTTRDWMLYNPVKSLRNLNIGTEVSRSQNFSSEFMPRFTSWVTPVVSYTGAYREDHRPEITRVDDTADVRGISNSGSINFGAGVPITRLSRLLAPKPPSPADTTAAKRGSTTNPLAVLLGKFGDIRANHSISYGSQYSRIYGKPDWGYTFGLRRAARGTAALARDGVATSNIGSSTSLSASGRLYQGLSLDAKYETSNRESEGLMGARVEKKTVWPELRMGWSDIDRVLRFGETVKGLRLDSSFRHTTEESGAKGQPSERLISKNDWSPFLSLSCAWKNGMRTSYTSSFSTVQTESQLGLGYTSKTTTGNHSLNLQQTVDATKGFSLPFASGRKIRLKSSVNIGVIVQYTTLKSEVPPALSEKRDSFSTTCSATYSFSANLSGSFNFGFGQDRDLQIGVTRRNMRLGLSASFRF
ncbi:MAG: hypothetical protein V2A71_10905, partial [Candidatus Eisenbacteria bacterium]